MLSEDDDLVLAGEADEDSAINEDNVAEEVLDIDDTEGGGGAGRHGTKRRV